jgi:hypothetical protein
MGDVNKLMSCRVHGQGYATFVCQHLVAGKGRGFYFGDDEDVRPDAWCGECDARLEHNDGEWNDEIEALAGVKLLCSNCYDLVRFENEGPHRRPIPTSEFTIEKAGWELADATRAAALHPDTFKIPFSEDLSHLAIGDLVKLLFAYEDEQGRIAVERMSVVIQERHGNSFLGTLDSKPILAKRLSRRMKIEFGMHHISSMLTPSGNAPSEQMSEAGSFQKTPSSHSVAYY